MFTQQSKTKTDYVRKPEITPHFAQCWTYSLQMFLHETCICISETSVCGPVNMHTHTHTHAVRSYALGQLKLLLVLCLFHHKKVTAWFMHLFCELDGNCLCFGAPGGSKHEIWKLNSVHELIYKVEQVLSCRIGSSWINTTLCVWVGRMCSSLPCPIILRRMSVEANICKHHTPCLWSPLGKDIMKKCMITRICVAVCSRFSPRLRLMPASVLTWQRTVSETCIL